MTAEAATSETVYETQRDEKIEWGREVAATLDAACRWMVAAGVRGLRCREVE